MNKEKKIAEFQNATVATIKAIAANKLKNREIQFFGIRLDLIQNR